MTDDFRVDVPFETKPPRLKDLVNNHIMGDVWVRDTPFGPVTDSLKIAEKFEIDHKHVLRAIKKCDMELSTQPKFGLRRNIIENSYLAGPKGREATYLKYDLTEFGLALLLLYINTPKSNTLVPTGMQLCCRNIGFQALPDILYFDVQRPCLLD